jgi:hypothetical protein
MTAGAFKRCATCGSAWAAWDDFVLDPAVRLLGLQVVAGSPDFNALVFEHRCGNSLSVLAPRLRHLLPEAEREAPTLMGTDQCRGHCRFLEDLAACDAPCGNARDRKLILLVERLKSG